MVFGSPSMARVDLAHLGSRGLALTGLEAGSVVVPSLGPRLVGVGAAGDVNGDGRGDLLVGSPDADPEGRTDAGRVFVVLGRPRAGTLDLAQPQPGVAQVDGAAEGDHLGSFTALAGDVDGDGRGDVLLGGQRDRPAPGGDALTLVAPPASGRLDLADTWSSARTITGASVTQSLVPAGDVNGDHLADLVINQNLGVSPSQGSFLVHGTSGTGTIAPGSSPEDEPLEGVLAPGVDLTGDGLSDLVVQRPTGRISLTLPGSASLSLGRSPDRRLPFFYKRAEGVLGGPIALAQLGGDPRPDLATGAGVDPGCAAVGGGVVEILVNGRSLPVVPRNQRTTPRADDLVGGSGTQFLFGGRGNDRIAGRAGDDCLVGGDADVPPQGADPVGYDAPHPDRDRLFGGPGNDTLLGGTGSDLLVGGPGDDLLDGQNHEDRLIGGPGDDLLIGSNDYEDTVDNTNHYDAGPGDDVIQAHDYTPDTIDCGPGRDRVYADRDDVLHGCERVSYRGGTVVAPDDFPPPSR